MGGTLDTDTPTNNAVVSIFNNGSFVGSGVLITPDTVVTNGHVAGVPAPIVQDYQWRQMPGTYTLSVRFGADYMSTAALNSEIDARWYNMPPQPPNLDWGSDIIMLGLQDPVPSTTAVPRPVNVTSYSTYPIFAQLGGTPPYTVVGFATNPRRRADVAPPTYSNSIGDADGNYYTTTSQLGTVTFGDSGGALLDPSGTLIGVNRQASGSSSWGYFTFTRGDLRAGGSGPDNLVWFRDNTRRSFCSTAGSVLATHGGVTYRKLMSLWSSSRLDNIQTTSQTYHACYPGFDVIDLNNNYQYYRLEGWLANSSGTGRKPLYLYWNPVTADNALVDSANIPPSPWQYVGVMGYAFTSSASGRVPLYLSYSASRQDYQARSGAPEPDSSYTYLGLLGYVLSSTTIPISGPD